MEDIIDIEFVCVKDPSGLTRADVIRGGMLRRWWLLLLKMDAGLEGALNMFGGALSRFDNGGPLPVASVLLLELNIMLWGRVGGR